MRSAGSRLLVRSSRFGWWSQSRNHRTNNSLLSCHVSVIHSLPFTTKSDDKREGRKTVVVDTNNSINDKERSDEEKLTKTQKLMQQIREAGIAGIVSYGLWEVAFWSASVPVVLVSYHKLTGHWPDLTDPQEVAKLGAQAFVYVNFSRFAVPLRIGLALSTTPWVQKHIVDRFYYNKKRGSSANNNNK